MPKDMSRSLDESQAYGDTVSGRDEISGTAGLDSRRYGSTAYKSFATAEWFSVQATPMLRLTAIFDPAIRRRYPT